MEEIREIFIEGKVKELEKRLPSLEKKKIKRFISLCKDGYFHLFWKIFLENQIFLNNEEYHYLGSSYITLFRIKNLKKMFEMKLIDPNFLFLENKYAMIHFLPKILFERKIEGEKFSKIIGIIKKYGGDFSLLGETEESIMDCFLKFIKKDEKFFKIYIKPNFQEHEITKALNSTSSSGKAKDVLEKENRMMEIEMRKKKGEHLKMLFIS